MASDAFTMLHGPRVDLRSRVGVTDEILSGHRTIGHRPSQDLPPSLTPTKMPGSIAASVQMVDNTPKGGFA